MSALSVEPTTSEQASHSGLVALTLSAVLKLQSEFHRTSSDSLQQALLLAAGDFLDRTLPDDDLRHELSRVSPDQQVPTLVQGRQRISAVPRIFWRAPRVTPNSLGSENYAGIRAVDRLLRRERAHYAQAWATAQVWLSGAWSIEPALAQECLALREQDLAAI